MCSETTPLCPSFSNDLSEQVTKHDVPRKDTFFMDSNPEFEFSNSRSLGFESSSADELFYNGVILPIQVQQERTNTSKHTRYGESPYTKLPPRPCLPRVDKMKKKESTREVIDEKKTPSKSFWGFSRSRSLNCDTNKNLVTSLPLARSKSTGSALNPKRMSSNGQISAAAKSSSSSSSQSSILNLYPLQKSSSGKSYTNGLRISPVLNVPTPCISKGGASLFMLGSFLRVGKVKKSKI
ncbi:unnamed protein product [Lupinus luteus]|uniref:Uncharacterized protein n=1 Tax=Lupinus luteus TaxID=3873 RepID=A0AAV1WTT9_LUPLU